MSDLPRSSAFQQAIYNVVRPGCSVIDVGTGTGLLAMFAAECGANPVVGIEYDPFVASVARRNIASNDFQQQVTVIEADALSFDLDSFGPFDVVLMELLTTGMIDEVQVPAVNNLHRNALVHPGTVFVPNRVITYVSLVQVDFQVLGLNMQMIRHLWFDFPSDNQPIELSDRVTMSDESFKSEIDVQQEVGLLLTAIRPGLANGLLLRTETQLCDGVQLWDTLTLNAPVVVPIEPRVTRPGEVLRLVLSYQYGGGYMKFVATDEATGQTISF